MESLFIEYKTILISIDLENPGPLEIILELLIRLSLSHSHGPP